MQKWEDGEDELVIDPNIVREYDVSWNTLGDTLKGFQVELGDQLIPGLTTTIDLFTKWLQTPWISNAIKTIGGDLKTLLDDINIGLSSGDWSKFWGDADKIWDALKDDLTEALNKGIVWLNANPTAITDFINGIIDSFTGASINTPPSKFSVAIQTFLDKIAYQIGNADWSKIDLALGEGMQNAFDNAMDAVSKSVGDWINNTLRGTQAQINNIESQVNTYPNATGSVMGIPTYQRIADS